MKRYIFGLILLISNLCFATPGYLPTPTLTPGAVDTAKTAVILCGVPNPGFSFYEKFPAAIQAQADINYGVTPQPCTYDASPNKYDLLVPLSLGGKMLITNTWVQVKSAPYYTSQKKDELDEEMYRRICASTPLALPTAQAQLRTTPWPVLYKAYVNTGAPTLVPTATNTPTNTSTNTPTSTPTNTRTNTPTNTPTP